MVSRKKVQQEINRIVEAGQKIMETISAASKILEEYKIASAKYRQALESLPDYPTGIATIEEQGAEVFNIPYRQSHITISPTCINPLKDYLDHRAKVQFETLLREHPIRYFIDGIEINENVVKVVTVDESFLNPTNDTDYDS